MGDVVTAAVITLALALLAAIGGLVLVAKWGRDQQTRGDSAHDLYRAQQELADDVRRDRDDAVLKLAASEKQLTDAKARLATAEQQRNKAFEDAREHIRKEIRNAPDAVAALNAVLAAAPRVQQRAEETKADTAATDAGDRGADPMLITELR